MAFTTTVRVFMHGVETALQDLKPQQYFRYPERELVYYANFGLMALAKYLPQAGARVDSIRLRPGSRQDLRKVDAAAIQPGDGSSPAETSFIALLEPVRNMGADGSTPGRAIRLGDRHTLDAADPDWHTAARAKAGVREVFTDPDLPTSFYVNPPVPTNPAVWIEVKGIAEPKKIPEGGAPGAEIYSFEGSNSTLLPLHDQYVDDLHNYVVAVALLKGSKNTQNIPKSQLHAQLFANSVGAQATIFGGTNPNLKALPFIDQIREAT